jgi:zinc and cadmium transporter
MQIWIYSLSAAAVVALTSLLAGILVAAGQQRFTRLIPLLVAFAAGIFLGNVFFHLLPESIEFNRDINQSLTWALIGVLAFFLLDYFSSGLKTATGPIESRNIATMNLLGDGVHNFVDGVLIAGSFLVSPAVGIAVTLALLLHEFPQECADTGVLIRGGLEPKTAVLANFVCALACIVGAATGLLWQELLANSVGILFGFSAGAFLYLALADLMPLMRHEKAHGNNWSQLGLLAAGVVLMALVMTQHSSDSHGHIHFHGISPAPNDPRIPEGIPNFSPFAPGRQPDNQNQIGATGDGSL